MEWGEGTHVQPIRIYIRPGTRGLFGDRPVLQAACFRGTTSGPGRFFHFFRQQPLVPLRMTSHVHPIRIRIATFLQTVYRLARVSSRMRIITAGLSLLSQ